jgi:nucleotide-binding universal stress UspA family protein
MYRRILVPLEHSAFDACILDHVRELARLCGSSLVLLHVADGFAARHMKSLSLRESEEIQKDRLYLEECAETLRGEGFEADSLLAGGDPATEITSAAEREGCDLIAMATHGHRGIQDVIYGTTANTVRHHTMIPVLMVRGPQGMTPQGKRRAAR